MIVKDNETKEEQKDIEQELQETKEKYLRLLAEFDNFRKRTEKEKTQLSSIIKADTTKQFLPILDDLQKAIENSEQHQSKITEGIKLIVKNFNNILKNSGVKEIKTKDEIFNPSYHEALQVQQSDEYPHNTILKTLQKGYTYKDMLIRPAKVIVSGKKEDKEGNEGGK
ncbi:MAG: nucleotide exchange factor GrpE [Deltaproteobacteria bacterium]|nr:nucleotide exchange factor GrpE [Deltaproteobacteria bacterium]